MHHLINLVVLCACACVCRSHVLIHTTNDLVDTASVGDSGVVIDEPDDTISTLDVIIQYTGFINSGSVVSVKRYKRNFIVTANCPSGLVRLAGRCVTCQLYEDIKDEDCPLKQ